MHLVSRIAQTVTITAARDDRDVRARGADLDRELLQIRARIRSSSLGADTGFAMRRQWIEEDARFALTLFAAV